MDYSRARSLGLDIQKAIFAENRSLYFKYFSQNGMRAHGYKRKKLQNCFEDNQWNSAQHLLNYWFSLK